MTPRLTTAALILLAAGLVWASAATVRSAANTPPPADAQQRRISELIRQLGDEQYPVRQQAQEDLSKLGAEAFDALVAAQDDDDLEIASRARYLVHFIRFEWVRDTDSPRVRALLKDYESFDLKKRWDSMMELVDLSPEVGLEPICRLVRFEKSAWLSKEAALALMGNRDLDDAGWPARKQQILSGLSLSARPAAFWLRAYVHAHDDPQAAVAEWEKLIDEELTAPSSENPHLETRAKNALLRIYAELLLKTQHRAQAARCDAATDRARVGR